MNADQKKKYKMIDQVTKDYADKKTSYETVPKLAISIEQVIVGEQTISGISQKQLKRNKGITKQKADIKMLQANRAYKVASLMLGWANKTNNVVIAAQVSFTKSKLLRLSDKIISPTCRNIYDLAVANFAALADYGLTDAMLQLLMEAITNYEEQTGDPQKMILDRAAETKKLQAEFDNIDDILTNVSDNLAEQLEEKEPDTYKSYKAARVMPKKRGGGKKDPPVDPPKE